PLGGTPEPVVSGSSRTSARYLYCRATMIASRRRADSRDSYRIAIENAPPEPAPPGPAPPEPAPPDSDPVDLRSLQHGVWLDRARVAGPAPLRLLAGRPGPPHV